MRSPRSRGRRWHRPRSPGCWRAGEEIIALVGARTRERLAEALDALALELDADDLAALERAIPSGAAIGERYPQPQMATLDSERG